MVKVTVDDNKQLYINDFKGIGLFKRVSYPLDIILHETGLKFLPLQMIANMAFATKDMILKELDLTNEYEYTKEAKKIAEISNNYFHDQIANGQFFKIKVPNVMVLLLNMYYCRNSQKVYHYTNILKV